MCWNVNQGLQRLVFESRFKTVSPKNIPLGRRPGQGKDGQNNARHPYL